MSPSRVDPCLYRARWPEKIELAPRDDASDIVRFCIADQMSSSTDAGFRDNRRSSSPILRMLDSHDLGRAFFGCYESSKALEFDMNSFSRLIWTVGWYYRRGKSTSTKLGLKDGRGGGALGFKNHVSPGLVRGITTFQVGFGVLFAVDGLQILSRE